MITHPVTYPAVSGQLQAYLARPDGAGPFPALVLIHEAWGLNEDMKRIARLFAGEGYASLAVDLFYGRNRTICMFRFFAAMISKSLNHGGIRDLKASLDYLAAQPFVNANHVGAVGYCMGGSFAVAWACTDNRLKAIAPYYASSNPPAEVVARLCPVVGSWPDPDFSTAAGRQLDVLLDQHHIEHDIKIYPNATHSFFNGRPGPANAAAAEDSWRRVLAFFSQHLLAKSGN